MGHLQIERRDLLKYQLINEDIYLFSSLIIIDLLDIIIMQMEIMPMDSIDTNAEHNKKNL